MEVVTSPQSHRFDEREDAERATIGWRTRGARSRADARVSCSRRDHRALLERQDARSVAVRHRSEEAASSKRSRGPGRGLRRLEAGRVDRGRSRDGATFQLFKVWEVRGSAQAEARRESKKPIDQLPSAFWLIRAS